MRGDETRVLIPQKFDPSRAGANVPALPLDFRAAHGAPAAREFQMAGVSITPAALQGGSSDSAEQDLTRKLLELGRSGDTSASVGYRSLTGRANESRLQIEERKRKDEDERFIMRTVQEQLDARLAELDARLAAIDHRLAEIDQEVGALDELDRLLATRQLDPNNPQHAALLRKAGISPADAKGGDLALILALRRSETTEERNALIRDRADVADQRNQVAAARADLERDPDDPAVIARAEKLASTTPGARTLGGAAFQTDRADVKRAAADAVGVSAESKASNRAAAIDTDAFFAQSDQLDWDSAGPRAVADSVAPTPIDAPPVKALFRTAAADATPPADDHLLGPRKPAPGPI